MHPDIVQAVARRRIDDLLREAETDHLAALAGAAATRPPRFRWRAAASRLPRLSDAIEAGRTGRPSVRGQGRELVGRWERP